MSLKGYLNAKSVTFWSGAALVTSGLMTGVHATDPAVLGAGGDLLVEYTGGIGAHLQIMQGLGLIGLRRKLSEIGR